jgi:hypothetical protein
MRDDVDAPSQIGGDYDPATDALEALSTGIADLDSDIAALNDLSAAEVNVQVDQALLDYDPATGSEVQDLRTQIPAGVWNYVGVRELTYGSVASGAIDEENRIVHYRKA